MSILRSGAVLISGSGAGFVLRFCRNILVARLISVEDYGIASTFLVAVSFVELSTNLNLGRLTVQNRRGDDPDFVAAIKGLAILRGVFIAGVLLAAAGPIAALFGQPELTWAYRLIALMPLLAGLAHPDVDRLQRQLRFGPAMLNDVGALGLTLALVWPFALLYGDFRVMLGLYLVEAAAKLALSFAIAERPYRVGWSNALARTTFAFAWPLTLSGLVTFSAIQGDRVIIANRFGAEALGLFSAAMTLVMPPTAQAGAVIRTFFLPILSAKQDDEAAFAHRAALTLQVAFALAVLAVIGFALLGPSVFGLVFGPRYAEGAVFVGLLGLVFGLQLARAGTATVSMARGYTIDLLLANLVRLAFLPAAVVVVFAGGGAVMVVAIGAAGQLAGTAASILFLLRRGMVRRRPIQAPVIWGLATLAATGTGLWYARGGVIDPLPMAAMLALLVGMLAGSRALLSEARTQLSQSGIRRR